MTDAKLSFGERLLYAYEEAITTAAKKVAEYWRFETVSEIAPSRSGAIYSA